MIESGERPGQGFTCSPIEQVAAKGRPAEKLDGLSFCAHTVWVIPDRLIDACVSALQRLRICAIIPQYERGVVLRFGVRHRDAGPGLRWLIPLIEQLMVASVIPTTETTPIQDLMLGNGSTISVACAVTWRVAQPELFLLQVNDGSEAVLDCLAGAVASAVAAADGGVEPEPEDLARHVRNTANRRAKGWGIRIDRVNFATFVRAKTVRLITNQAGAPYVEE